MMLRPQWRALILVTLGFGSTPPAAGCTLAIEDVAVIAMIKPTVDPNQTILIEGAKILAVGPANTMSTAACRQVIDGRGKFLAPGLVDAHVHLESEAFSAALGQPAEPIDFPGVLALYPAFGVTSVRVMSGAPDILAFRDAPAGAEPVPRLIVASPMLAGSPPVLPPPVTFVAETPEAARDAVERFVRAGYDLIKVRENLRPEVFRAIASTAEALGIDVDGHVTRDRTTSLADLMATGQRGFAHLDEVARAMVAGDGVQIMRVMKDRGTYVSTAMVVLKSAADQIADFDHVARRAEARFMHPFMARSLWSRAQNPYLKPGVDRGFFLNLLQQTQRALKQLNDAGVTILAGSDALNPMIIPGVGLHEEMRLMIDAGLTPFEAIRTATVHPAKIMKRLANAGIVAPGHDADLVLLSADPLKTIVAYRRPEGVILQGRWFDRAALDRRLETVAAKFHNEQ